MLTIEEIKKELDVGHKVDLECVDGAGYKNQCDNYDADYIDTNNINVLSLSNDSKTIQTNNGVIYLDSLKYFRIKRPSPTFDDLIDVAVQAQKDGLLFSVNLIPGRIEYQLRYDTFNVSIFEDVANNIQREIDFINSLYTETFVISNETDFHKLGLFFEAKLANGTVLHCEKVSSSNSMYAKYTDYHGNMAYLDFFTIKGATVTQSRGEK